MIVGWFLAQPKRLFYGWWIVIAGLVSMTLSSGLFFNGFGFYFLPIQSQFGWSSTAMSGAVSLSRLESGLLGPLEGYLIQRHGPQRIMLVGFVVFALGFAFLSQANNIFIFYVAILVMALGSGLAGFAAVVASINNWFRRNRSKAFGISMLGLGLGGVIFSSLLAWSISAYGWPLTALASGGLLLVLGIPISRVVRFSPEPYGYLPDGDDPNEEAESPTDEKPRRRLEPPADEDFTWREALKTPAFWIISVCHALALVAISATGVHQVAYMEEDLGLSGASAALVVVVLSSVMMVCQPMGGFLGDRYSKRHIAALCLLGHGVAMVLLAMATGFGSLMVYAVVQGLAWGTRGPIITAMRGDYFGRKDFALINGYSQVIMMMGMIVGPLLAGFMADNYSYSSGFLIISGMVGAGSILFLIMRKPIKKSADGVVG